MNQKSSMNVGRESDGREVPAKSLNKDGRSSAEGSEGRRPAKENINGFLFPKSFIRIRICASTPNIRDSAPVYPGALPVVPNIENRNNFAALN
jgi:hypothetical protein